MSKDVIATLPVSDQIKVAMDGRTQRTVSMDVQIPEADFSRKMKNNSFTEEELSRLEQRLNFKIIK